MIIKTVVIGSPELIHLYECHGCRYEFGENEIVILELLDVDGTVLREVEVYPSSRTNVYFLENGQTIDSFKIGTEKDS